VFKMMLSLRHHLLSKSAKQSARTAAMVMRPVARLAASSAAKIGSVFYGVLALPLSQ
jgi:hypothetical protein